MSSGWRRKDIKTRMRSRLRLEVEPAEAGKQLLTTENTDPHGNSILMLPKNFGHRPLALVWIERAVVVKEDVA